MAKFSRRMSHFQGVFSPSQNFFPSNYIETVIPVVDVLGSSKLAEIEFTSTGIPGPFAASFVTLAFPLVGFRYIKHCSIWHDSPLVPPPGPLGFHLRFQPGGAERINLQPDESPLADIRLALEIPIIVPPGFSFGVHMRAPLIGGETFFSQFITAEIAAGEVLPHLLQK